MFTIRKIYSKVEWISWQNGSKKIQKCWKKWNDFFVSETMISEVSMIKRMEFVAKLVSTSKHTHASVTSILESSLRIIGAISEEGDWTTNSTLLSILNTLAKPICANYLMGFSMLEETSRWSFMKMPSVTIILSRFEWFPNWVGSSR